MKGWKEKNHIDDEFEEKGVRIKLDLQTLLGIIGHCNTGEGIDVEVY